MKVIKQLIKVKEELELLLFIFQEIGFFCCFRYTTAFLTSIFYSSEVQKSTILEWVEVKTSFAIIKKYQDSLSIDVILTNYYLHLLHKKKEDIFLKNKTFDVAFHEFELFLSLRNKGYSTEVVNSFLKKGLTIYDIYNQLKDNEF